MQLNDDRRSNQLYSYFSVFVTGDTKKWIDDGAEPGLEHNRRCKMVRPCSCGCDLRDGDKGVGYVTWSFDGFGYTIWCIDEDEYQEANRARRALIAAGFIYGVNHATT